MSSSLSDQGSQEILGPYFTNLKVIGTGGSGAVYSAIDTKTDKRVALKRVNLHDQVGCKTALRQITVYNRLQNENIVRLEKVIGPDGQSIQSLIPENAKELSYIYMVQELVEADLHTILQSNGTLSEDYVKLLLYQLLRGVKYVHSSNVIHRDIKPSNVLVDPETLLLKIGDFGQTRVVDPDYDHHGYLSHCPSTLWYKAPEVILNPQSYTNAVDMWGVGCVFAEMLLGKPLFEGRHELEQIQLILDSVGPAEDPRIATDVPEELIKSLSEKPSSSLASKFPGLDSKGLDLIEKMLSFSPKNRISAEEALSHPYLQKYSFPSDEPSSLLPLNIEYEVDDMCEEILKDMLYTECISCEDTTDSPVVLSDNDKDDFYPENDILSLKDIMNSDEEPISSCNRSISDSASDINISSFKFHPELQDDNQNCESSHDSIFNVSYEKNFFLDRQDQVKKSVSPKESLINEKNESGFHSEQHDSLVNSSSSRDSVLDDLGSSLDIEEQDSDQICSSKETLLNEHSRNNEASNKNPEKEDSKNGKSQQEAGISKVVMETFLGKDYQLNLGFSCKMNNTMTGPFGLCYL